MRPRVVAVALLLAGTTACLPPLRRGPSAEELTLREWVQAVADARVAAESGRHADTDQILATFAARHPGTPQATETLYWRGLYRLDAANRSHTATDALAMLDAYLAARPADTTAYPFRHEAVVLRRVAAVTEQLGKALQAAQAVRNTPPPPPTDPRPVDITARDQEIVRLRDELAKANAELERIKRRLAAPRP